MNDYSKKNKKGISETVFEIDEERLQEIRNHAKEKAKSTLHNWKQKGSQIVCDTCDFPHGMYIGTGKVMVGIEGNVPKFVDRHEYMRKLRDIK